MTACVRVLSPSAAEPAGPIVRLGAPMTFKYGYLKRSAVTSQEAWVVPCLAERARGFEPEEKLERR